jgi:tRNA pseudouridine38-40 synthase
LRYDGKAYCGWQKQPGDPTVQQTLEETFSMVLRQPVDITGCGRTDTGVHARKYVAHTDVEGIQLSDKLIYQLNAVLPDDIAIDSIKETGSSFHARFDALERHYRYFIHFHKDPFLHDRSYYMHQHVEFTPLLMQEAAEILAGYQQFKPFCKTGSDADHYKCIVKESKWIFEIDHAIYSIKANRFLRGMVRLIVGTCLNIGLGKMYISDLKECLETQSPIPQAWSVPPEGLYLEDVIYPWRE